MSFILKQDGACIAMQKQFISAEELLQIIPYSRAQVRRLEQSSQFPKHIRLGPGKCVWIRQEIEQWLEHKIMGRENG